MELQKKNETKNNSIEKAHQEREADLRKQASGFMDYPGGSAELCGVRVAEDR